MQDGHLHPCPVKVCQSIENAASKCSVDKLRMLYKIAVFIAIYMIFGNRPSGNRALSVTKNSLRTITCFTHFFQKTYSQPEITITQKADAIRTRLFTSFGSPTLSQKAQKSDQKIP